MTDIAEKIQDVVESFKEYLEMEEAQNHIATMKKERKEVKDMMHKLSEMDNKGSEFTDLVLYGLLPYSKTKAAKRISLFPAFMNIKLFFKEYKYTDREWNILANKIFNLCQGFANTPNKLADLIKDFTHDKYSRSLQCGSISPIFFCLNDSYPVVNNRTRRSFRSLSLTIEKKEQLSQKLNEYLDNVKKIDELIDALGYELIKKRDYQDLFFYWYDSELLSEERRIKKQDVEEAETAPEVEDEIKIEEINVKEFIEAINIDNGFDFKPHSLADPQRIKINQIVSKCDNVKWVLPHFQRYFDWTKTHVRDLWESIFHDYYIGSFLLWAVNKSPELGIQPILGVSENEEEIRPETIILDGQQRMTSLFYAIKAPKFSLKGSKEPLYFYINFYSYFKKDADLSIIEARAKKISHKESFQRMLFPLYELENYNEWVDNFEDFLLEEIKNADKVRKIRRIIDRKLRHIWDGFEVPYVALPESMELYQVTDIFEAINTKGKLLSVFDLLIARLYKYNIELKKMWDATLKNYPNILRYSKNISKTPIYTLQAISLLYEKTSSCKRADILNVYSNIYEEPDRNFEDDWDEASDYINKAIGKLENMRDGFGVKDEKEIPFAPMIPILAALLKVIDSQPNKAACYKKLVTWYWSAVFTNAYSSAVDSQLTADFRDMKKWFNNDSEIPRVVIIMRRDLPHLYFRDIQSKTNAKYRGIMSLIALEGAKDFDTSQTLENARNNDKDHLFPKAFQFGFGSNKYVNSVLNMTWMSDDTNRKIKRYKKPSIYTKEFIEEKYNNNENNFLGILKTHFIDEAAFKEAVSDKFEDFLAKREKNIIAAITQLVQ